MPEISPFAYYILAYKELSTCRNGMNPRIPFTAIVDYAKIYEIENFEEFLYLIRRMDEAQEELGKVKDGPKGGKGNSRKG